MWALLEALEKLLYFGALGADIFQPLHSCSQFPQLTHLSSYRYSTFILVVVFSMSALVHPTRTGIHITVWLKKSCYYLKY